MDDLEGMPLFNESLGEWTLYFSVRHRALGSDYFIYACLDGVAKARFTFTRRGSARSSELFQLRRRAIRWTEGYARRPHTGCSSFVEL